jgi:Common central domain of tyrosinase/Polyphenol oxidase middle domain
MQVESLRRAVAAMQALPTSDRRSWSYLAAIHGTLIPSPDPLFNQCEHGTIQFLAWHRGYLYFFERILRWAAQDPSLSLPYWDWASDRSLPDPFRNPADSSNPLYDGTRFINDGSVMPPESVAGLGGALGETGFAGTFGFSTRLEGNPHGSVHVAVNGNMGSVPTAARDPIFWLHHCNIDRLWDYWLNQGAGRADPSDAGFLDQQYSFADETGGVVAVRVRDIITSSVLGYRYDDVPSPPALFAAAEPGPRPAPAVLPLRLAATSAPLEKAEVPLEKVEAKPLGAKSERVKLIPLPDAKAALRVPLPGRGAAGRAARLVVKVEGISADATPGFTYAVYLNLPEGEVSAEERLKHYLGTITFFGKTRAEARGHAHAVADTFDETFDATLVAARLQQAGRWDPENLVVTILPLAPTPPEGARPAAQAKAEAAVKEANVRYKRISVGRVGD